MRCIRFRAWSEEHGKYSYPQLWDSSMPSNWERFYTLEQFTGLLDKNGVDIYEGDIVRVTTNGRHATNREILWKGDMLTLGYSTQGLKTHIGIGDAFEVIGNIHENPELLGGE